jgi:hypothetical protein
LPPPSFLEPIEPVQADPRDRGAISVIQIMGEAFAILPDNEGERVPDQMYDTTAVRLMAKQIQLVIVHRNFETAGYL